MQSLVVGLDASLLGGQYTGDRTYWRHLIRALTRLNLGYSYLLYTPERLEGFVCEGDKAIVRVVPAKNRRWWSLVRLPLAAQRDGVSLLHSQYTLSPLLRVPAITTVHDVSFLIGPRWFRAKDRLLLQTSVPASIRRAARVITVSETSKKDIEKLIPAARGKTVVTPLAAPDGFYRVTDATDRVRSRFGIEERYLLAVGTLHPRKNLQMLAHAFEKAREQHRLPHRLVLVGKSGWGRIPHGEALTALGYVQDQALPELYSAAEAFCFPSLYEGFGLPLLEAMSCGCPVLCSDGGALPEVAGEAARILPASSADAWTKAIVELVNSAEVRTELAEKGLLRARMFSWRTTAERTADVYMEVAR